jgi:hypothetical protein
MKLALYQQSAIGVVALRRPNTQMPPVFRADRNGFLLSVPGHTVPQERQVLVTLSQLDDFVPDTRGDLTILAQQLAQFQEFA